MRTLLSVLISLMLVIGIACAEESAPTVFPLPEEHVLLDYVHIANTQPEETLLLLGCDKENAVKLAVIRRIDSNGYLMTALSGPILSLNAFVPEQSYMHSDEYSLYLWYGVGDGKAVDEVYLLCENTGTGVQIRSGYVSRLDSNVNYSFGQKAPGLLAISGELPYPELEWTMDFSLDLNGFSLPMLETECLQALDRLRELTTQYREGDDIPGYTIHW